MPPDVRAWEKSFEKFQWSSRRVSKDGFDFITWVSLCKFCCGIFVGQTLLWYSPPSCVLERNPGNRKLRHAMGRLQSWLLCCTFIYYMYVQHKSQLCSPPVFKFLVPQKFEPLSLLWKTFCIPSKGLAPSGSTNKDRPLLLGTFGGGWWKQTSNFNIMIGHPQSCEQNPSPKSVETTFHRAILFAIKLFPQRTKNRIWTQSLCARTWQTNFDQNKTHALDPHISLIASSF